MENNKKYKIKEFLLKATNSGFSENDLLDFIHYCKSLLKPYFRFHNEPIVNILVSDGLSIDDICIDCIGSFLTNNNSRTPLILKNFAEVTKLNIAEEDPLILFIRFSKYLEKTARNYLLSMEFQYDPASAKIKRNIKHCIKKHKLFFIKNEVQGLILYPNGTEINLNLRIISFEEFEELIAGGHKNFVSTMRALTFLYEIILDIQHVRKAVPLRYVVQIMKYQQVNLTEEDEEKLTFTSNDRVSRFDINQAINLLKNILARKLITTYLSKGITEIEAKILNLSYIDIITELVESGKNDNYYEYFSKYSDISREEFEKRFRSKIDYMIRISRDFLKSYFYDEDSDNT